MIWIPGVSLKTIEIQAIRECLEYYKGNRTKAAEALGISLRTIRNKITEFGFKDDPFLTPQAKKNPWKTKSRNDY